MFLRLDRVFHEHINNVRLLIKEIKDEYKIREAT